MKFLAFITEICWFSKVYKEISFGSFMWKTADIFHCNQSSARQLNENDFIILDYCINEYRYLFYFQRRSVYYKRIKCQKIKFLFVGK